MTDERNQGATQPPANDDAAQDEELQSDGRFYVAQGATSIGVETTGHTHDVDEDGYIDCPECASALVGAHFEVPTLAQRKGESVVGDAVQNIIPGTPEAGATDQTLAPIVEHEVTANSAGGPPPINVPPDVPQVATSAQAESLLQQLPEEELERVKSELGDMTVDDVLEAVGDDKQSARMFLAAERARGDSARKTLVAKLEEIEKE